MLLSTPSRAVWTLVVFVTLINAFVRLHGCHSHYLLCAQCGCSYLSAPSCSHAYSYSLLTPLCASCVQYAYQRRRALARVYHKPCFQRAVFHVPLCVRFTGARSSVLGSSVRPPKTSASGWTSAVLTEEAADGACTVLSIRCSQRAACLCPLVLWFALSPHNGRCATSLTPLCASSKSH